MYRRFIARRVVVNLTGPDEGAVDGTLAEATKEGLIVEQATYLGAGDPRPMDGAVLVPSGSVHFVQVL